MLAMPTDLGDWEAEYRALSHSCALVARADRRMVRVEGEQRLEMLNGLLTNQVADLEGVGRHAMLLTPKGGVLTDLWVLPRVDHVLLDVPQGGLQNLLNAFRKYLPPIYATFEDTSSALRRLSLYGPDAAATVADAFGIVTPEEHLGVQDVTIEGVPLLLVRNRRMAVDGVEIVVSESAVTDVGSGLLNAVSERGGRASGSRALDVVRVEHGVPEYGVDITEANLVQETTLEQDAVSYDKGCYLGQEVVARVHFRGHVNRHLRSLRFVDTAPAVGATLVDGEKDVGKVTSSVESPEFGLIGLGYVRREVVPPAELRWVDDENGGEASVLDAPVRDGAI